MLWFRAHVVSHFWILRNLSRLVTLREKFMHWNPCEFSLTNCHSSTLYWYYFWFSKLYLHFEFAKFGFPAIKPTYALSISTRFFTKLPAKLISNLHMHSFNIRCMPHALVKITKMRCNYKIKKNYYSNYIFANSNLLFIHILNFYCCK